MVAMTDLDIAASTPAAAADPHLVRLPLPLVRALAIVRAVPDALLLTGAALVVAGFGLIAYGWGKVAALHVVGLQMPYLASTVFPGAGLVICGVACALMAGRNRDAVARRDQLRTLATTLDQVAAALETQAAAPPVAAPLTSIPPLLEITDQLAAVVDLDAAGSRAPRRRR